MSLFKGKHFTLEMQEKSRATRLQRYGQYHAPGQIKKALKTRFEHFGEYIPHEAVQRGIEKRPPEWHENVAQAARRNAKFGPDNHFFGKRHTEESRRKMSENLTGSNNPGWNGGASLLPYGPGFTRKFKKMLRERDGYRCQRCGLPQKKHHRALEIHHIDHDKFNNDPTNLITVCGSCNVWLSYHRDESPCSFPKRRMLLP